MTLRVTKKIHSRLKLLHRKNRFLDVPLRRLLCIFIQPHFDYVSIAWHQNLIKKLKDKLKVTQNTCIRFCLKLKCREQILSEHSEKRNWLPIHQRFEQCVTSKVFIFLQNKYLPYMNEVFRPVKIISINTRNNFS